MLDALINAEVEVTDVEIEDGVMSVYTVPTDFGKAQKGIEDLIPDVKFDVCEITLLPQEYVTLDSDEDKELWERLINMLNECEDVQQIYHNVQN
jgi:transcriptional/translational regulatory protein YebC/TACO1